MVSGDDIAWGYRMTYRGEKTRITNCFYPLDPAPSGGYVTGGTGTVGKTQAYMKSSAMVDFPGTQDNSLNHGQVLAQWKQDFAVNPINNHIPLGLSLGKRGRYRNPMACRVGMPPTYKFIHFIQFFPNKVAYLRHAFLNGLYFFYRAIISNGIRISEL